MSASTAVVGQANDQVRPFTLDKAEVHGRYVRLGESLDAILGKHAYPPLVENLLAEMLVLTTALASTLKFEGILTLQIRGKGPVSTMVADVQTENGNLNLRGYAAFDEERIDSLEAGASIPKLIGEGSLAFTLDQGQDTERYQGIVALEGATLVDCLTHYFAQSDQFSMAIKIATDMGDDGETNNRKGHAITLQRLPDTGGKLEKSAEEVEDDWRRTVLLMGTAKNEEMLDPQLTADDLLFRLFHEEGVRVFDQTPVRAKCRCSKDRIYSVLKSMSDDDLNHAAQDGAIDVVCEFCADKHSFTLSDLRP